jgi:hypothetical protein
MTSARPFDSASTVENRWKTRTGSSELSTVTPEPSLIREVSPAIPASTVSGAEIEYSGRWCSPSAIASTPSSSASTASCTTCRIAAASDTSSPVGPSGTSPNVSRPNSSSFITAAPVPRQQV